MATINSRDLVDQIIANDGYYDDDPRVLKVIEYSSKWGTLCWGVLYPQDNPDRYKASPYVVAPRVIWEAK